MKSIFKITLILGVFIGALIFSSCSGTNQNTTTNIHGIDIANFDTTCEPCENFYQYANGNWVKRNPIPPEYSSWSVSHEIYERNAKILREVLENAAANSSKDGSIEQLIGYLYSTAMDTVTIEELGFSPLEKEFAKINGIKNVSDVQDMITNYHNQGISILFEAASDQDLMDNTKVILYAIQGGLGLPDRDYYTKTDQESATLKNQYTEHIANMFQLTGDDKATAINKSETILAMETRLAEASLTQLEMRDPMSWYNFLTVEKVDELSNSFVWSRYLSDVGLSEIKEFSYAHPKFFGEMDSMLKEFPLDDWKTYISWHVLTSTAQYLSSDFVAEDFHFYSTVLYGTEKMRPRWKRVLSIANRSLGEAVGQLYVKEAFPPAYKQRALEMVGNLQEALKGRIENLVWMSDETKVKALEKLSTFTPKIGYPDRWRDYSSLTMSNESYLQNVLNAKAFETRRDLNKIGKPVDKNEWGMSPQTINAYYNPLMNEVVFPAGILQPPFFDGEIDDAINYGAMGAIIGHEMTHGFDDEGRKFDAIGNFNDWWTEEDAEEFKRRTDKLITQFDDYIAVDTFHVNGQLTLGENIADLGGLTVAYYALQKALEDKPRKLIDGFTPEQRFFLSFAQAWRGNQRPEDLKIQVQTDPHTPAYYRAIGTVSNMSEFKQAFKCKDGDAMVRSGADQVIIW